MRHYSLADVFLVPLILGLILLWANSRRSRNMHDPVYVFFRPALLFKLFLGLSFCAVYSFYYSGGDTTNYHQSAFSLVKLLFEDVGDFFTVWFGPAKLENLSLFNAETGYPKYMEDPRTFMVPRLVVPFELITYGSYPGVTLITAVIAFLGSWRLFTVLARIFPRRIRVLAWAILFIPSVSFWGTGIMKDTFTMSATMWVAAAYLDLLYSRKSKRRLILEIILASWLIISIKPYIFVALLPSVVASIIVTSLGRMRNPVLRTVAAPFIVVVVIGFGAIFWSAISSTLGQYGSIESMVEKADVSQRDLKRDAYQGRSIDIGSFDGTVTGAITKFPEATVLGMFRPFIWESQTAFMLLSGLEGFVLLILTIYIGVSRFGRFFRKTTQDPIFTFCLAFAIIMAFSVGLSTSNFGSLVRYRIPVLPFLSLALIVATNRIRMATGSVLTSQAADNN